MMEDKLPTYDASSTNLFFYPHKKTRSTMSCSTEPSVSVPCFIIFNLFSNLPSEEGLIFRISNKTLCSIGQQPNGAVTTDTIFIGIAKALLLLRDD
jgi:hypothetical protein